MEMKMQRYDKDAIRLLRGEKIVGMLLRMTDDRWGIYDLDERPLTKARFLHHATARDKAAELIPTGDPS